MKRQKIKLSKPTDKNAMVHYGKTIEVNARMEDDWSLTLSNEQVRRIKRELGIETVNARSSLYLEEVLYAGGNAVEICCQGDSYGDSRWILLFP